MDFKSIHSMPSQNINQSSNTSLWKYSYEVFLSLRLNQYQVELQPITAYTGGDSNDNLPVPQIL